ncbi:MAG: proton-conducting transporter membrane subunit [Clostridia bacterium]
MSCLIILPIIIAIGLGVSISYIKFESDEKVAKYAIISSFIVAIIAISVLFLCYGETFVLFEFNKELTLGFHIDGIAVIFAGMVSVLWPIATIYASKYMIHDGGFVKFFTFYILTFGIVLGTAFSNNLFVLYVFYEALTFITLPLVIHNNERRDIYSGKKYLIYSVGGAAVSFMGMMIFVVNVGSFDFAGATMTTINSELLLAYVLMFMGFSVKAGIFPCHDWLISAGVAPTTVTALLHAVAVVKAGSYAVIRVTYSLYNPVLLRGTFAQYFVMTMIIATIVFGSLMAMKSKHIKRRLAFSTVSQLSYILLGIACMSNIGLTGAFLHMINHAFIKIVLFYVAGNVVFTTHKEYIKEIEGFGKKMKTTFLCFTLCSLSLMGIPPFGGFFSKFALAQGAIGVGGFIGFLAVVALMMSAVFTAMYLLQLIAIAYVTHVDFDHSKLDKVEEAPKEMVFSIVILTAIMIAISLGSMPLYNFIQNMIGGII